VAREVEKAVVLNK